MKIMFQIFIVSRVKLINRAEETDLKPTNFTHEKTETISSFINSTTVSITATHSRWLLHGSD
jgi:hypothetical protein